MEKAKIDRINELGRIAKTRELTFDEQKERAALRNEYIAYFRSEIRKETKNEQHKKTKRRGFNLSSIGKQMGGKNQLWHTP